MIKIQKVTSKFKVSPASIQTFIDTPNCILEDLFSITRSTFRMCSVMVIFKSSIVWGLFEYTEFFLYCNHQVDGDFLITLKF
jgi:hypothetical protein